MVIEMYSSMKVVGKVEDSFEDKKQQVMFYQLIVLQGKGAETITCTKEVYDNVTEGVSYIFHIRIDTRTNNKIKITGVGVELYIKGAKVDFIQEDPFLSNNPDKQDTSDTKQVESDKSVRKGNKVVNP